MEEDGFNLKREASPLATYRFRPATGPDDKFQSQARSQSPSDGNIGLLHAGEVKVSISSEKPVP